MKCYCCSGKDYDKCCKPFLEKLSYPKTPLQLMRSRYSAFVSLNFSYLEESAINQKFDNDEINWAKSIKWEKLKIIKAKKNIVEFKAYYSKDDKKYILHEKSSFINKNGKWLYSHGKII